ncbi:hypothetical protein SASPL_103022 [Salvia splendens]|uniref:Uncharacterized protein n=1 Tax=Salvia splendens TaxID=180675 RepID=A0A8X9AE69_SALSN|nr:hypothetical protein SASPL_103022 [Salvia splendens]
MFTFFMLPKRRGVVSSSSSLKSPSSVEIASLQRCEEHVGDAVHDPRGHGTAGGGPSARSVRGGEGGDSFGSVGVLIFCFVQAFNFAYTMLMHLWRSYCERKSLDILHREYLYLRFSTTLFLYIMFMWESYKIGRHELLSIIRKHSKSIGQTILDEESQDDLEMDPSFWHNIVNIEFKCIYPCRIRSHKDLMAMQKETLLTLYEGGHLR